MGQLSTSLSWDTFWLCSALGVHAVSSFLYCTKVPVHSLHPTFPWMRHYYWEYGANHLCPQGIRSRWICPIWDAWVQAKGTPEFFREPSSHPELWQYHRHCKGVCFVFQPTSAACSDVPFDFAVSGWLCTVSNVWSARTLHLVKGARPLYRFS